jgi:anhydro-N-acetylmuramic acid kinase
VAADLFLGLISGTSADGIDAVLMRFDPSLEQVAGRTFAYPEALRAAILGVSQSCDSTTLDELGELDAAIGEEFAKAATALLDSVAVPTQRVAAIGSHGQTLRHRPRAALPFTLQAGDPHRIAERCGITTVADFRRRDVAAGGQGAPLVPGLHAALFSCPDEDRAVLNLGGIGNFTLLPRSGVVQGFDTGPANGLLDAWGLLCRGQRFDRDGAFAREGRICPELLDALLDDPYFAQPPPKSTGRDHFHLSWLQQRLAILPVADADVQATLVALSARSIGDALHSAQPATARVLACGGGVHNPVLMDALGEQFGACRLETTAAHGLDPDFVEAAAFAWLARETLAGRAGNVASATGASGPRVLGAIIPA